ncbi:MAG: hypothetical protein SA339_00945 [Methanomassiliicoccus sp.]|nr:hypothetical protein [Methanomassiliicoccus sp.]
MTTYEPPPYQPTPQAPYYPAVPRHRPFGVTLLAILEILYGILLLIASFALFGAAYLIGSQEFIDMLGPNAPQWLIDAGPVIFGAIGVVILIMAIIAFLLAWGFLKGKRWAWILGIIFTILSILGSIFSAATSLSLSGIATLGLSILIPVIVLIYLLLPSTKAWFTR